MSWDEPTDRDDLRQIEDLLRALPLRRPPPSLDNRVGRLWHPPSRRRGPRRGRWAAVAAAAAIAAALLVAVWGPWGPEPSETQKSATPVTIERVWSRLASNEVVAVEGGAPVRRLQRQIVRHVQLIDEEHDVRIEWNIPSEQVIDVPLEYN
jgi:hypothetical protein